jgi:hypothetical protein
MPLPQNVECIERIFVRSQWIGFADPCFRSEDLEVVRRHELFIVNSLTRRTNYGPETDARPGDMDTVAPTPEAVERLLFAIEKPPLGHPQPENLGVDLQSLRTLARNLMASPISRDSDALRLRRAGLSETQVIELLSDPDALRASLVSYYRGVWTDDSPEFEVRLGLVGGAEILLESKSQMPFMLPWRIQRADPGPSFETFDADVSRNLAACLPEVYLNRSRLLGRAPLKWPLPEEIVRCRLWELGRHYSRPQRLRRFLARCFGR